MTTTEQIKNVVLVHGAFADGSGWRRVYDRLTARGYRVSIVQNPLTSFTETSRRPIASWTPRTARPSFVGHSWGGTVITEAGVHPKVAGLVYVVSPDSGRR